MPGSTASVSSFSYQPLSEERKPVSIVITGATGQLGRLAVEQLLGAGVPADQIVATGRDIAKLGELAAKHGVQTRQADLADPASLAAAFAGADKVLLVSTTTPSERFDNHRRAIDAARNAGVSLLVYTSTLNASDAEMLLADAHRQTENYLRDSGVPFVILRNGWYLENYTAQLPLIAEHGALLGSAKEGRVSAASRRDYATAAAAVLTRDGHAGATYELGGDAFTLSELATSISEVLGDPVSYRDIPVEDYVNVLRSAGLPDEVAETVADADAGLARGELFTNSRDLERLLGQPATTRQQALAEAAALRGMTD
jgi:NAD(P)H dehydrogenase (quinone)